MRDDPKPHPLPDAVAQSQKLEALGALAGGIAHDFNNILSIIEGHTDIALKHLAAGTLTPSHLEKIRNSTARGAGLTRQLLAFGRQKVDMVSSMDMTVALAQVECMLRPLFGEQVTLRLSLPAQALWVEASEDHLTQIVLNLALNARDALPLGGDVSVSCMACGAGSLSQVLQEHFAGRDVLRLSVVDNGAGISPAVMPRIFEPFFSSKERGRGTGMGLAVVYGIVEQLGGRVDVKSSPGAGTAVHIYLPAAQAPQHMMPEDQQARPILGGRTILLAEDEPELCDILGLMLEGFDMKVIKAVNGNHALELQQAYAGEIDFLLTDVVMPEMDGVQLAEVFAARRPATNVIYMSGYPFLGNGRQLPLPDRAHFISKPIQEDTVRQVLERALARRDARLSSDENDDSDQS